MNAKALHALAVVVMLLAVSCGAAAAPASQAKLTTLQKIERDYIAEQLLVEADSIAREVSTSGTKRDFYQQLVRQYVPVYMASVCVEGGQPSAQDFNAVTRDASSAGRGPDVEAVRVIKAIDNVGDTATQQCLQPYLYPESISDASPALELYLVAVMKSISAPYRDRFKSSVRARAAGWFQTDRQESFITWMCKRFRDNECGL